MNIAFASNRSGHYYLYARASDGSAPGVTTWTGPFVAPTGTVAVLDESRRRFIGGTTAGTKYDQLNVTSNSGTARITDHVWALEELLR